MAIKTYKPYTPSRRFMTGLSSEDITAKPSVRSLLVKIPVSGGRNSNGRITSRHKEGGAKKLYRIIDFKRRKFGIEGKVEAIEYDPNRNCRIALIAYKDGEKRYIIRPNGLNVGDIVAAAETGLAIKPGKGAQMARSAGGYAQLMGKEEKYVMLRLPSGEMRQVLAECMASIGVVGNEDWANVTIGKAGRNRHRGIRPQTRGSAMNPVDHPHGGGEGKKNSGRHPVTPWGKPTKGAKTRRKKASDKLIISRRKGK